MIKSDLDHVLFTSAYLLCLVDALIFGYSTFSAIPYSRTLSLILRAFSAILVLIKLVLDRHYSLGLLNRLIIVGMVLLVTYVKSGYSHIFYLLIICLGMRNVDEDSIISLDFCIRIVLCMIIIFCGLSGIIENYITYRTNSTVLRYSIGFNHPNTVAGLVLSLILEDSWINQRRATSFYLAVIWIIATITYLITVNRTAVLIMILFPVALMLGNKRTARNVGKQYGGMTFAMTFPFAVVFSYVTMILCRSSRLFSAIDIALSNRFYNASVVFRTYGASMLGQKVDLVSVKAARFTNSSIALLDVAYLRLLIQAGFLVLGLLTILYGMVFRQAWRKGDHLLVVLFVVFILFGLCESGFNNVFMNFTLLFAAKELFISEERREGGLCQKK